MKAADRKVYQAVYERSLIDDYPCCERCGANRHAKLEMHHKKLRSQGGKTEEDNLVLICKSCHMKAHKL